MDLVRYAPELVLRRLAADPRPLRAAWGEQFPAVVLWVDISGFTPLTERLVAAGDSGVEALTEVLNRYFGRLVDLVQGAGGDITQFEGDAILAVWRLGADEEAEPVLRQVARCALEVSAALHGFEVGPGTRLSQRVALATGPLRFLWVGGVLARWAFAAAGAPLVQVQAIDHDVDPGEVVVAPDAWAILAPAARGTVLPSGAVRLEAVSGEPPRLPLERSTVPPDALPALRTLLPGAVLTRLQAGLGRWLAELRRISVVFVHFPELDPLDPDLVDRAQEAVARAQRAVYRFGASTLKFSVADKGATLLAGFGVPPLAHEDDPVRAVQAALALAEALQPLGIGVRVGVATGPVFCGLLGSEKRCEYTILGRPVNLAARLMQAGGAGVLVDEATWQGARHRLGFTPLSPLTLKGVAEPVAVYRPTGEERAVLRERTAIVGRAAELDLLSRGLQALVRAGDDATVVVEGEAGIGKSRLVAEAVAKASELGVRVLTAEAQAIERDTAYFAWRGVAAELFGLRPEDEPATVQARVMASLADDPEVAALAPLLQVVLPVDWPDNERTAEMVGEMRADNTRQLLVRLIERAARLERVMLVIEDAHWLDSASWEVAMRAARDVHPCLVLVATRPMGDAAPAACQAILEASETTRLTLQHLSPAQTLQLVCQRLGVVRLPEEVGRLLIDKSGGNPFFSEELAYALRDAGKLLIEDGICGLAPGEDLESLSLPGTVQGAIISRVDRLDPARQLLLKVASVIGREFLRRTLAHAYPSDETHAEVDELLPSVVDLDLVLPDVVGGEDASYVFKHAISQETIYGLMLFAQRRELHRRVAEWFEARSEDLPRFYPLLAWHYSRAEVPERAVHYLELAGSQALGRFACREAVRFYTRALEQCEKVPALGTPARLRTLEEGLALAYHGAGDMDACRRHGVTALELLGLPTARGRLRLVFGLLAQVGRRVWQARRPPTVPGTERRERLLAAARLENKFSEIAVFREENLRCLYAALRQLNLAYPTGPSPELGRAYAVMSTMLGTVPLPGIADAWVERARETAAQLESRLDQAWIWNRCACYELYRGRWEAVYAGLGAAIEVTERLGDRRLHEETLVVQGLADIYRGRFAQAEALMARLVVSARASGNQQTRSWGLIGRAECLARMGSADEALALCAEVAPWVDGGSQSSERMWGRAVHALAALHAGDLALARRHADFVYDHFIGSRPVAFWNQQTAPVVAEVYRALLPSEPGLTRRLKRVVRNIRTFGKIFPFGGGLALYWGGVLAEARGRLPAAQAAWRAAIALGERLDLAYDQGLAHRDLARTLPEPARAAHAEAARDLLLGVCQARADLPAGG
ncbi:MAG: AAA family ATPase [Myxococcales bacterium]|nr:AAA family ATPase [Myxococcales bacterium]